MISLRCNTAFPLFQVNHHTMSSGLVRDSRCRRSISESNLPTLKQSLDDELPLNAAERRAEAIETLRVRKEAMQEALDKKLTELRAVCLREGVRAFDRSTNRSIN